MADITTELEMESDSYFDAETRRKRRSFDAELLREPLSVLPVRTMLLFDAKAPVADAMRAMQAEHTGCVLITEDGTAGTPLRGIFTERDILLRIIDRGRNPTTLPLGEVMVAEPESLPEGASIAWVLNKMSVGGFRHVPVVDEAGRPRAVVSVRDVVQFLVEAFPGEVLNLPPEFDFTQYRDRDGA